MKFFIPVSRIRVGLVILIALSAIGVHSQPADSTRSNGPSAFILVPAGGYQPETRFYVGVFGQYVESLFPNARPTNFTLSTTYSQNKQVELLFKNEMYTSRNGWVLSSQTKYRYWPDLYFGIGNGTHDSLEESYTAKTLEVTLKGQRQIAPSLYVGGQLFFNALRFSNVEAGGTIARGAVRGSSEHVSSAAGIIATYDDRDNIFWPRGGWYVQSSFELFGSYIGSDFAFTRTTIDARRYISVFSEQVIALQLLTVMIGGDAPFDQLAFTGGENRARGYRSGRYRDNMMLTLQAEIRTFVWWRFGAVCFAGVTQVAPRPGAISIGEFKPFIGIGGRFDFGSGTIVNGRADIGVGGGGSDGIYIGSQESF